MSNIRLFFQESLSLNLISKLDKSQSHYLFKVMRVNIGQTFSLFNESGEWEAKIKDIKKKINDLSTRITNWWKEYKKNLQNNFKETLDV